MHVPQPSRREADPPVVPDNAWGGRLLAKVGHELRTPLNVILGMLHLSLNEDVPTTARQYLETARESAIALTAVLDDVLDYSDAVSGSVPVSAAPFSLRQVVDDTIASLVNQANEKGLRLISRVQDDLPDQLVGDGVRLRQVLLHLLSNAVKFTDGGELEVRVVGTCPVHDQVSLTFAIIDSGSGLASGDQPWILSPFEQVERDADSRYDGGGLGLTIAAEFLVRMGGQLSVDTRRGQGCQFSFQLSLPTAGGSANDQEATQASDSAQRAPLRILVAEDTPGNQQVIRSILNKRGHSTLIARHGAEAVETFRRRREAIDVILMDVQMPVMSGYEATAEIRRLEGAVERRVPIIALTAHAAHSGQQECFSAGMDAYIAKPLDVGKLTEAVEHLGYGRRGQQESPGRGVSGGPTVDIHGMMKRLGGDLSLVKEFVQVFDEDAPRLLRSLRTALRRGDASVVERSAHSLKGLTANFGATRLMELAEQTEELARDRQLNDNAYDLVQQLEQELSRLTEALEDYR